MKDDEFVTVTNFGGSYLKRKSRVDADEKYNKYLSKEQAFKEGVRHGINCVFSQVLGQQIKPDDNSTTKFEPFIEVRTIALIIRNIIAEYIK